MRASRIGTRYIVLVWMFLILLLGSVLMIGYNRNIADLQQLMTNEANQLIEIVTISAQASIHSLDEVESLTERRLLDNARLIEQIAASHDIDSEHLKHVIADNGLHMVNILDASGNSIYRATDSEEPVDRRKKHHEAVRRVLSGESDEEIIGFMESQYYSGKLYGVVVKRRGGGAVVVNAGSDEMLSFRKSVGLGTLFHEIGDRKGVRYIVLQDMQGIVTASRAVTEMGRIADDPFLLNVSSSGINTRLFDGDGMRVFEIVKPLVVDNVNLGLLRIGLNIETFDAIRIRAIRQFVLLFVTAAVSGAFLFIYIMLRQNYRMLNREHDRILIDVRRMEEESRRSERLASMGRLAGGVAHEIRNPLNAISIIAQRLRAEFAPAEGAEEYRAFLNTIGTEIDRIKEIVENFLRYVRPPKMKRMRINLSELIQEAIGIVQEKARSEEIDIKADISKELHCQCDPDQLKQALLNLLLNAIDAVGSHGSVTIDAGRASHHVRITVTDTGQGIPDTVLPNIFDPYFTTKDHGSGLGLSEVHRIVSAHGGTITAENGAGRGAMFTINLPVTGERG